MTLALSTITSSGIVLSADSRQTYTNRAGAIRIGSDSAAKLFKLSARIGLVIAGRGFLQDEKGALKPVSFFVRQFQTSEFQESWSVEETAGSLNGYLTKVFAGNEMARLRDAIEKEVAKNGGKDLQFGQQDGNKIPYSFVDRDGQKQTLEGTFETVNFVVGGIDTDGIGRAYIGSVPKGVTGQKDSQECGAFWIGQTDVLQRIIMGSAPEIGGLKFVQDAIAKAGPADVRGELGKLQYLINWGTMTVQDAVDFCVLITRTTESIQRFSDGTLLAPGGIPGVGGEIDVAAITPEKGFVWLKKKRLRAEGEIVDLDESPDIKTK